ncbi:hypothetical protein [Mesorhizobium sp. WSM4310]|uniref:hypothetical protein n=1 Tax=Mesorhizobium sp. WSM4310 TaxID=2589883 RepID=UPI001FF0105F|nr:hypothetical protein [Mesorhizobium sp. WSM4310]
MVATIIRSVGCELSYTVTEVIKNDEALANDRKSHKLYADFLRDWGVEVALNLTIVERTSVNPTAVLAPASGPSSVFTLAGGLTGSAEATRTQKTNVFFTVADLYRPEHFDIHSQERGCRDPSGNKHGSLLVDSDLRLNSLLQGRLDAAILHFANSPGDPVPIHGDQNVLSQSVSFKIVTSGNLTPAWKLVRATINPGGTLFSTGRDRTHELVFTFGPLDKSVKGKPTSLIPLAEATHQNSQLQTGLKDLVTPFQ